MKYGAILLGLAKRLDRHWLQCTLLVWAAILGFYLWQRSAQIHWLVLNDTDDNMRLMQVRGLLAGQGWYDLRQYRLNPPGGLDIHWSRLVDLPIAALILILKPFTGTPLAERLACGIAPLLPLGVALVALAATVRRLVAPMAWPLAILFLFGCSATLPMFMPMRIDHHGWQLACLSLTVAGLADPRKGRGGALVGLSSAVSLTIGLELLPYCAMAGGLVALRWVWDRAEARRLALYGATLAGGSGLGFVVFASDANYAMRCDALTPVWLTVTVAGGAALFALSRLRLESRVARLAAGAAVGAAIAGGFALRFPQCLSRPEGVSQELADLWLNNVREAKPIYKHPLRLAVPIAIVPVLGLIGAGIACWRARRDAERFAGWLPIALFTAFAGAMLLWQVRAGPAAQMLGIVGEVALAWLILSWFVAQRSTAIRVAGATLVVVLVLCGLFATTLIQYFRFDPPNARVLAVNRATARCMSVSALAQLDRFPAATMFTHVDLGPRLIVATHHDGITGPYHRNERPILDVHHAFQGSAAAFRPIAARYGATYLLTCPNVAETTLYRSRAPGGFYSQLAKGRVPAWLEPVALPKGSPFRLWRIRYAAGK
ncbi:AcrB/AcrD/AcrF family protein [Sphingomonas sp. ac-8]|uniref:AcrB/AcrD/AcrF family protein n=1 Tax=Sphingomonas sp. ac-8 TaxID=3242977 RepID=UPI003A802509